MNPMRRAAIWTLAFGYALSFAAVCLAACFMPAIADHACCAGEDGIRATQGDCCSVTPGLTHGGSGAEVATAPTPAPSVAPAVAVAVVPAPVTATAAVSSSPPLVLRV